MSSCKIFINERDYKMHKNNKNIVQIKKISDSIMNFTKAESVFLYGSRSRGDICSKSDYEFGVLMYQKKYINRSEINKIISFKDVSIFPFVYEDFIKGDPDTPFVKNIYLKELIKGGKTIAGKKIIEKLKEPQICLNDIISDVRFNIGYALSAIHSYRAGDEQTAILHFTKSCLFGTRDYIIFRNRKFPINFNEIVRESKNLNLEGYQYLPEYALKLRRSKIKIKEEYLFKNISYLNKFINSRLVLNKNIGNNTILIKGKKYNSTLSISNCLAELEKQNVFFKDNTSSKKKIE